MPDGEKHVDAGECSLCEEKAWANAKSYITNVVLPEFATLRSKTMGLDEKVVLPPWVQYYNNRPTWVSKVSDTDQYVFCNWDVGAHNMMFDYRTLDVIRVYDWENAGFFPLEFQFINRSRQEFDAQFEDVPKVRRLIALLDAQSAGD